MPTMPKLLSITSKDFTYINSLLPKMIESKYNEIRFNVLLDSSNTPLEIKIDISHMYGTPENDRIDNSDSLISYLIKNPNQDTRVAGIDDQFKDGACFLPRFFEIVNNQVHFLTETYPDLVNFGKLLNEKYHLNDELYDLFWTDSDICNKFQLCYDLDDEAMEEAINGKNLLGDAVFHGWHFSSFESYSFYPLVTEHKYSCFVINWDDDSDSYYYEDEDEDDYLKTPYNLSMSMLDIAKDLLKSKVSTAA